MSVCDRRRVMRICISIVKYVQWLPINYANETERRRAIVGAFAYRVNVSTEKCINTNLNAVDAMRCVHEPQTDRV